MKRLKTILLFLVICISCFAPKAMAMGSSEPNFSVEEEVSAVSIIATDQGVRVLNANGATLEIYNILGFKIASYRIDSTDKNITLTLGEGCYLFKVRDIVRKISIKKEVEDQNQVVEKMPEFPGGMAACLMYITNAAMSIYPEEAAKRNIQGSVIVGFAINEDGSITDVNVVKPVHPLLDEEAKYIIRSMPKWKPGIKDGKPMRVRYTLPVTFRLQ